LKSVIGVADLAQEVSTRSGQINSGKIRIVPMGYVRQQLSGIRQLLVDDLKTSSY